MSTPPELIPDYAEPLPDPSDADSFTTRGLAFWNWERYTLMPGFNTLVQNAYDNAIAAELSASTAESLVGAEMWSAATSYAEGDAAISPTNGQTYRRKAPGGVDATDPAASSSWWLVGGTAVQKAGDTGVGSQSLANDGYISKDSYMQSFPSHSGAYAPHYVTFKNIGANKATYVGVEPSGTGTGSGFYAKSQAGTESKWAGLTVDESVTRIHSSVSSTAGSANPIAFAFKGVDKITFSAGGVITPYGIRGRQGTSGAAVGNAINLYWTGTAVELWVDTVRIGTLNITA